MSRCIAEAGILPDGRSVVRRHYHVQQYRDRTWYILLFFLTGPVLSSMVDKARDEHGRGGNILIFKEAATNFQRLFYHILHGKGQRRQEKVNMSLSYLVRLDDSKKGADICHDQHNHEYRNTAALNSAWSIQFPVNTLGILISLPANIYILGSPYTPRSKLPPSENPKLI